MARSFTAGTGRITYTTTSSSPYRGWSWGTIVAVVRRTTSSSGYRVIHSAPDNTETYDAFGFQFTPTDQLQLWVLTNVGGQTLSTAASLTLTSAEGWAFVAVTRASGSATPSFWMYKFSTGVWSTATGDTNIPTNSLGFGNSVWIGNSQPAYGGGLGGDIAAVMSMPARMLSDGEIRRLVRGRWSEVAAAADFLQEFPSNHDSGTGHVRTLGRVPLISSAITDTARTAVADPPGFRFSAANRRR